MTLSNETGGLIKVLNVFFSELIPAKLVSSERLTIILLGLVFK